MDEPANNSLRGAGVKIRYFPIHPSYWLGTRYAYSPQLNRCLHAEVSGFDVVHIHGVWLFPTWAAAQACQRLGVPYLVSPCGALDPYGFRIRSLFKWVYGWAIERGTLGQASFLHFTSPLEERLAFRFYVKTPSVVIPRSLDLTEVPNPPSGLFRAKYPQLGRKHLLLFLGRLHPKKRLDRVAHIFSILAKKREDLHLVIAGPDEGAASQIKQILKRENLLDRATFTGLVTGRPKWEIYRDSTLFLLPSEDENFAVTALEAMAMSIPVLVSKGVGLADWVSKYEAGLVLDADISLWVRAIENLLDNPVLQHQMGESGRALVAAEFGQDQTAVLMQGAYEKMLRNSRLKNEAVAKSSG